MKTVNRKITELTPADYNPRAQLQPGDVEFEQLKSAILEIGFATPLVVNKATGRVVGGHQRLAVLEHLGWKTAPVVEVDLDETSEKALNLALNKIEGRWDEAALADVLLELEQQGDHALHLAGFTGDQLDDLMRTVDQQGTTSFLDDIIAASTTPDDPDAPDEADEQAKNWTALAYPMTGEARRDTRRILEKAADHYAVPTSGLALLAIVDDYLAQQETA